MISYRMNESLTEESLLKLYNSVNWINYTRNPDLLMKSVENSLCTISAYDNDKLVGLIRVVGDGYSIVFIQDLLVLPSYQRQGIGSQLLKKMSQKYSNVYQLQLTTDNITKNLNFYHDLGFIPLSNIECVGLIYQRR